MDKPGNGFAKVLTEEGLSDLAAAIKRGSEWVKADDEWDAVGNNEGLSGFFCLLCHFKPNLRKELGDDYDADPIDDDKSGMFQFRFDEWEAGRKAIDASPVLHIKPDWKGTIYIFYLANKQNVLAWVDGEVMDFSSLVGLEKPSEAIEETFGD